MTLYTCSNYVSIMVVFLPNVVEYLVFVMFLARVEMFVFLKESAADLVSKALLQLTTAHKVLNHMV